MYCLFYSTHVLIAERMHVRIPNTRKYGDVNLHKITSDITRKSKHQLKHTHTQMCTRSVGIPWKANTQRHHWFTTCAPARIWRRASRISVVRGRFSSSVWADKIMIRMLSVAWPTLGAPSSVGLTLSCWRQTVKPTQTLTRRGFSLKDTCFANTQTYQRKPAASWAYAIFQALIQSETQT